MPTIRPILLIALLLLVLPSFAERQEKDGVVLMVGNVYPPEQSADRLNKLIEQYAGSRDAWEQRRAEIRRNILAGANLTGLPEDRPPLNVIRHSKRQLNGYTVENVALETLPGFWLCGNLYLPEGYDTAADKTQFPGVLTPHGHRINMRLDDQVQARSGAMARMGCVVFAYDMVGYTETNQVEHKQTPNAFRLQTWNSIRALDYLTSLPHIDNDRLGVTGGSGGGTQSFVLTALDDRIDLSMPVVMVAAHFFGGCVCESGMPVHVRGDFETNNAEIAACAAPRPMLLVSDGKDWTKNNPTVELPYLKRIYGLYDAADNVENTHLPDDVHNYGPNKRKAICPFIAKHFKLDLKPVLNDQGDVDEAVWYTKVPEEDLHVFDDEHPRPGPATIEPAELDKLLDALLR